MAGKAGCAEVRRSAHADFARFLVSGGIAAAIQFSILHVGVSRLGWRGLAATSVGFVVAAVASYVLNYHWTFKSAAPHRQAIPRFLLVAGSGLGLNALVFAAMQSGFGAHYLLAQVFATGVVLFWNFVLQRGWSFTGGGAT